MKTWLVGPKSREWVAIIHAPTKGKAKKKLQDELQFGELNWVDIRASRIQDLDGKPVTGANLIAAGFDPIQDGAPIRAINYVWACGCELCAGAI